jgi:hypothetical protein
MERGQQAFAWPREAAAVVVGFRLCFVSWRFIPEVSTSHNNGGRSERNAARKRMPMRSLWSRPSDVVGQRVGYAALRGVII